MGNKIEVLITQGLDVPIFFKDVPNFINNVPNESRSILKWGTTSNHFMRVSKRNKWTMGRRIGVMLAQGLDVSNFLNDVPRVSKSVSE